jgi:5-methylcytosine-specific restriction protein A
MTLFDATGFARELVGERIYTIGNGDWNQIVEVKDGSARVRTKRSTVDGEWVNLSLIQEAADRLEREGELRISKESLGHMRTAFVGAVLASHPRIAGSSNPARVILREKRNLSRQLEDVMTLLSDSRRRGVVVQDDPLYPLVTRVLRDAISAVVNDDRSYKVNSSIGAGNWAETVWAAVFDLNVTDRATAGYYLVYLFSADGDRVFLSLCQATTAVYDAVGGRKYEDVLRAQGASYAGLLGNQNLAGLAQGPIDLGVDNKSRLTRGYAAGSVVAIEYRQGAVPAEGTVSSDLMRMLSLYSALVERVDEVETADGGASATKVDQTESRRLRWHLRAEGRNRVAAIKAKKEHGYWCDVCEVDFENVLGSDGERCIDAHHLTPFHELDERPRHIQPDDFAIVCANCHRLLHSSTPPLSVNEARTKFPVEKLVKSPQ